MQGVVHSRSIWRSAAAAVALLALLFSGAARAQPALVLIEENDALAAKRDFGYTQGFRASLVFSDFANKSWVDTPFDLAGGFVFTAGAPAGPVRRQFEWIVGQSVFTPNDKSLPVPDPRDRPYAGWLYTGAALAEETAGRQLDGFELLAGVVGPSAGGKFVQCGFHSILGQSCPVAWAYQLKDQPAFLAAWERRWKIGTELGDGYGFDVVPSVGVTLGNVFTYASAGGLVRVGRSLSSTWGPTRVRPGDSGLSFFSPNPAGPWWGFALFAGVQARAVLYDLFMAENTSAGGFPLHPNVFVADFIGGAEIFSRYGSRLAFTVTRRTNEFSDQPGGGDFFGSVEARVQF
jgi:hypothetical protein